MRVLEVMGSLHRGGAETMIMNYYRAFDKKVCQMDFIIHGRFENDYYDEAVALGANVIETESPGNVGIFKYIVNLIKIIRKYGPYDAIHIHTDYQAFLSVIAAKITHVNNIIVHSHCTSFSNIKKVLNRFVFNIFNVQRVACGKAAGETFFGNKPFIIINNAVDLKKFSVVDKEICKESKKQLFGNYFVIGHIGRFNKLKNHEFIVELAKTFSQIDENIIFVCYGEGEEEERIKKIVDENKISNIRFMGTTNDVVSAYNVFDLFILPSLKEGFPVTLIESQISGVYSLTSDNVSRECDLGMGILKFLPLEIDSWKNEILKIKDDDKTNRNIISEKTEDFNVDIQWKKLYKIYKDCK